MATLRNNIPEKTIERLSEYRRTLLNCHRQGITHIFSHILAGMHGITAVQVRRDLMLIGFSSDTKKGYDVKVLIEFINGILDSEEPMKIGVIGMGHLGQAITKYFNGKGLKLRITAAFDIDPAKVGTTIDEIPCYHLDELEEVVANDDISIIVVSSPSKVATQLVVPIINAGRSFSARFLMNGSASAGSTGISGAITWMRSSAFVPRNSFRSISTVPLAPEDPKPCKYNIFFMTKTKTPVNTGGLSLFSWRREGDSNPRYGS